MLPGRHRITRSEEFARVIRRGARAGRSTVVVHLLPAELVDGHAQRPVRAGFVVNKAVGSAAVRNRVVRRLRHIVRDQLTTVPGGSLVVVRALPAAAKAGPELADDVAGALGTALKRGRRR